MAMFEYTRSLSTLSLLATPSVILWFAWWWDEELDVSRAQPASSNTSREMSVIDRTATLKAHCPS
jgi:hypothetical protein